MNATGLVNSPIAIRTPPTNSMMPARPICDINSTGALRAEPAKQLLRTVLQKSKTGHDAEQGVKVRGITT